MSRLWRLVDRRALVVTLLCLAVWRLLEQIPIAYLSAGLYASRRQPLPPIGPAFFAVIGGQSTPFAGYSVGYEGIGPYVEALVVLNFVMVISARVKATAATGTGRLRIVRWARTVALSIAMGQAYGFTQLLQADGILPTMDWSARLAICLQLTGGTAVMLLLAGLLDEHGLGFGYGALVFYVLGPFATEVHRLADFAAYARSSGEVVFKSLVVWTACSIGVTIAGVAILLATRKLAQPSMVARQSGEAVSIRFLAPGLLRPTYFAFLIAAFPPNVANVYAAARSSAVEWLRANWGPYGPNVWLDATYLLTLASLVMIFAVFVTALDLWIIVPPSFVRPHMLRLAGLGGLCLAVLVVVAPLADHVLTAAAGLVIPMSGYDVLLTVAMVFMVIRAIEGHQTLAPYTASPSGLP
ncbi:MAG: hypothetical protein ACHQ0J_08695 [Candidatus Dormibacterales bacterium]